MSQQYTIRLSKVTGFIIVGQRSTRSYAGSKVELEKVYREVLTHNLLFGWWGIFSFVWNVMAITRNAKALKKLRSL